MKHLILGIVLVCLAAFFASSTAPTSSAQAIVSRFPEDGTWARYEYKSVNLTRRGPWVAEDGEVFIRCLETVKIDMVPFRWIEVEKKGRLAIGDSKYVHRWKVLISEAALNKKRLTSGEGDGVLEIWMQMGGQEPKQFKVGSSDLQDHWLSLQPYFLNPKPNSTKDLADVELKLSSGDKLACTQKESDFTDKASGGTSRSTHTSCLCDEAPFGIVKSEYRTEELDATKKVVDWSTYEIVLVEIGKDAESSFPDWK